MADQKINALPTKTSPSTGDKMLMIGTAEEYQIDYDQLATAILNKLSTQSFSSLDTTSKTVLGAIDELNSKIIFSASFTQNGTILEYIKTINKNAIAIIQTWQHPNDAPISKDGIWIFFIVVMPVQNYNYSKIIAMKNNIDASDPQAWIGFIQNNGDSIGWHEI